jgi:hypothetical protein
VKTLKSMQTELAKRGILKRPKPSRTARPSRAEYERRRPNDMPPYPLKARKGRRSADVRMPLRPEDRARRYLTEGRVTITLVEPGRVLATCFGHKEEHRLGLEPGHGWWCSCPQTGLCSHLLAVQLVTEVKPGGFGAGK